MTIFRFAQSDLLQYLESARFAGRFISMISVLIGVMATSGGAAPAAGVRAGGILPHEAAFERAAIVVQAEVLRFDAVRGVEVRIDHVVRGDIAEGSAWRLPETAQFPFLNRPGTQLTIFGASREGREVRLVSGPTAGGLIWQDEGRTIGAIQRAFDAAQRSLQTQEFRERLAAAYYLAVRHQVPADDRQRVGHALIDALALPELEANQTGVDGLRALGIEIEPLAGPYHPGFKPELKAETAAKVRAWWLATNREAGSRASTQKPE